MLVVLWLRNQTDLVQDELIHTESMKGIHGAVCDMGKLAETIWDLEALREDIIKEMAEAYRTMAAG